MLNVIENTCNELGGLEVFNDLELAVDEKNDTLNLGHPFTVDLEALKCPCGTPFLDKSTSSICAACGSATCSAECHAKYAQDDGKCLFIRNFVENEQTVNIQGLRTLKATDFINAVKLDIPYLSPVSISNSRFMRALRGASPFTVIVQRGFRQYGQPHVCKKIVNNRKLPYLQWNSLKIKNLNCLKACPPSSVCVSVMPV